jgi:hypothetical protein
MQLAENRILHQRTAMADCSGGSRCVGNFMERLLFAAAIVSALASGVVTVITAQSHHVVADAATEPGGSIPSNEK